jgi:hypothetical protein
MNYCYISIIKILRVFFTLSHFITPFFYWEEVNCVNCIICPNSFGTGAHSRGAVDNDRGKITAQWIERPNLNYLSGRSGT